MIDARRIAEAIWKSKPRNIELSKEIIRILVRHGISEEQAVGICSELRPKVKRILEKKIESCHENGTTPKFYFSPYSEYLLVQSDGTLIERKEKIFGSFKKLNWEEFEDYIRGFLSAIGIKQVGYIGRRKEGGVDFFGILDLSNFPQLNPLLQRVKLRVVGQIRRYKNKINEGEAKKVISYFKDLKAQKGRAWKKLPDWFKEMKCPFIEFLVTSSLFTGGAREALDDDGVIRVDGDQLADWVARTFG